ncbi:hypothetical protein HaLaN_07226 [Haematococcus lacustris]|uniref:Uncharacterized protein n=1 Tax=Haematococcus lacustris TaxID=44745 RepID=A0A699YXF1_HAELA|nr:hypothetical protein HaLaN_07226 [Haematococcus lacustris]
MWQVQETDVHTLMSLFDDLAHADFESESAFNLTEASLLKVSAGLNHLGQEFAAVGNTDLDAMFLKRQDEKKGSVRL